MQNRSRVIVSAVAAVLLVSAHDTRAQVCGDADDGGNVTLSDGVNVLRAAAELSSVCTVPRCDADGDGRITVTDGVNVLREAAGIPADLTCGRDSILNSVRDAAGTFGPLVKVPGGLVGAPGAAQTVQAVQFGESFVSGRTNTIVVTYDVTAAAEAAGTDPADLRFLVASALDDATPSPGVFALPVTKTKATLDVALNLRDDLAVQQFQLRFANGVGVTPIGRVETYHLVVIREAPAVCGNRVLDGAETCDPPVQPCPIAASVGVCSATCVCQPPPGPAPTPGGSGRFVDNGDGTITDSDTGLQWEKKTTAVGSGPNYDDPHDVDNLYRWCPDDDENYTCDPVGDPRSGELFTEFLVRLNTPPCFANRCDWRIPSVAKDGGRAELELLLSAEAQGCGDGGPCIDPAFGPTIPFFHWSDTQFAGDPFRAWGVFFNNGAVYFDIKGNEFSARAVRGP